MAQRDIVVIGASAGGLEAVTRLVRPLPADLAACLLVVIHTSSGSSDDLSTLIARSTSLPASTAADGDPLRYGHITVAPPGRHLLVRGGHVAVTGGPQENGFRPAVDPLFRSAAHVYAERVTGVVLSGGLDDGTHGLMHIKRSGGVAIAQHPDDAVQPNMPLSAARAVEVDHILPAAQIGPLLERLAGRRTGGDQTPPPPRAGQHGDEGGPAMGPPTAYTCPDCGGPLREVDDGQLTRYICHVGHAYSEAALGHALAEYVEGSLWRALRVLRERASFEERVAQRAASARLTAIAARGHERAREAHRQAEALSAVLAAPLSGSPESGSAD